MAMMKKALLAVVAKKVADEARKPQNQQRARDLMTKMRSRQGQRRP